jgi:hypothetical protein
MAELVAAGEDAPPWLSNEMVILAENLGLWWSGWQLRTKENLSLHLRECRDDRL